MWHAVPSKPLFGQVGTRMGDAPHLPAEIREQPEALRRLLAAEGDHIHDLAAQWRAHGDLTGVMLAARGSSDNVARYGQYVLGIYNRMVVALAAPSIFSRYRRPLRLEGFLIGAISQSGRSPDVVSVVREGTAQRRPTFAITNDAASPVAAAADAVIALRAGREQSVAATKTYTCSLGAVALVSAALSGDAARAQALAAVPQRMAEAISETDEQVPEWLTDAPACAVVGRGFNYATAFEIALKLKELTGMAAEPYSSADFLHGPVAALGGGMPVILVAPSGEVSDDVAALATVAREHRARLVIVSEDEALLASADLALPLPGGTPEWLSPLVAVIPGQILAWRLAEARGLDVDRPAGLRKVTETR